MESSKFTELTKLDLFDNKIKSIEVLKNVPFKQTIKELDLSYNSLESVDVLDDKTFNFEELRFGGNDSLDYSNTKIKDIYDMHKIKYTFESLLWIYKTFKLLFIFKK